MLKTYVEYLGDGDNNNDHCQPGVIHLGGAACQADYTLCGITLDGDPLTAGNFKNANKKVVTCESCIQIINECKGVRIKK